MSGTEELPVVALRETAILPGVVVPLTAGRPRTVRAVEAAAQQGGRAFVVAQKAGDGDAVPDNLHRFGVVARILQAQRYPGGLQLAVEGEVRAHALAYTEADGFVTARVQPLAAVAPLAPDDPPFVALVAEVVERAEELVTRRGLPEDAARLLGRLRDEPGRLADAVATHLELPLAERQALLEETAVEPRLRRVLVLLRKAIGVAEAQDKLRQDVETELGGRQRELFLREQLKAIQKELGEGGEGSPDLERLKTRIAAHELPDETRAEVERQLARAAKVPRESAEGQVVFSWLEWIADLPWSKRSKDAMALADARRILDEDHFGLADVKRRVLELLATRELKARRAEGDEARARAFAKGPVLLFLGPPGTGKTSVARSIARALGRQYVRVALGGARDEADIRGHRRTYIGSMPGRILQGIRRAGTKNPVVCLDEIDKLGASFHGDPGAALLEVLDGAQNDKFTDHYLDVPFDLSEVLFVCTANYRDGLPAPLLDRMEPIEFAGYTEAEKVAIADRYLVGRALEEAGLTPAQLVLRDGALAALIAGWTREAGLRQLEREIGKLARRAALQIAEGKAESLAVDPSRLRELLGRPKARPETRLAEDEAGVSTGLYYTPMGGDIMFVEASLVPGEPGLTLTGQLGDVMKESARAALTWARRTALALGVDPTRLERTGLHVHVPAGAVPKDGPSAGIAMAAAIVSALTGRPVRADFAMTGEITLRGRVLPIGGVKEKVLGALRAGITRVILPRENLADLEDLPPEARARVEATPVDRLEEALELLLPAAGAAPVPLAA